MSTGRVLVVDDVEGSRYVFGAWLRRAGYLVDEAATGAEALALVADNGYDVVLLDMHLPDVSGTDVCKAIKADPATGSLPVLHVSATAVETSDRARALREGADAYLVEPIDREELLATVGALLRYSEARRRAETLAARLSWLHTTALEINAARSGDRLATLAAEAASRLTHLPVAVAVQTEGGAVLAVANAERPVAAMTVERSQFDTLVTHPSLLADLVPGSLAHQGPLMLTARGRLPEVSAVVLVTEGTDLDEDRRTLLLHLGRITAVAAENLAFYTREHRSSVLLQESLLAPVPPVEWLEVAVRYDPSTTHASIGGDFYDVVVRDDGQVALVIGDVQGHSLQAAAIMATLRNSLAAFLIEGHSPAAALRLTNKVLQRASPGVIATACCVLLDPFGRGVVANAGHLPPIIAGRGGARLVPVHGTILGIDHDFEEAPMVLDAGAALVMFTDGLVERRRSGVEEGLARALEVLGRSTPVPDEICRHLVAETWPGGAIEDDVAVLVARLTPARVR